MMQNYGKNNDGKFLIYFFDIECNAHYNWSCKILNEDSTCMWRNQENKLFSLGFKLHQKIVKGLFRLWLYLRK